MAYPPHTDSAFFGSHGMHGMHGFLSPTDYTDCSDFNSSFSSITRFARDFVHTQHNPNKFGFCSRLLQNSLFDCVKGALRIYTDVTRFARFLSLTELLFLTECTELTEFFSLRDFFLPQITQITLILILLFFDYSLYS